MKRWRDVLQRMVNTRGQDTLPAVDATRTNWTAWPRAQRAGCPTADQPDKWSHLRHWGQRRTRCFSTDHSLSSVRWYGRTSLVNLRPWCSPAVSPGSARGNLEMPFPEPSFLSVPHTPTCQWHCLCRVHYGGLPSRKRAKWIYHCGCRRRLLNRYAGQSIRRRYRHVIIGRRSASCQFPVRTLMHGMSTR